MKLPLTPDALCSRQRTGYLLLEIGLLLVMGCLTAVYFEWRYHPLFASNPLNSLSFWQKTLFLAAVSSIMDLPWVLRIRRWENPWPVGISLTFMLFDALGAQFAYLRRRQQGRS